MTEETFNAETEYHILLHKGFDVATKAGYKAYTEHLNKEKEGMAQIFTEMGNFFQTASPLMQQPKTPEERQKSLESMYKSSTTVIDSVAKTAERLELVIAYLAKNKKLESQQVKKE